MQAPFPDDGLCSVEQHALFDFADPPMTQDAFSSSLRNKTQAWLSHHQ
jgi:hypothetical protein